MKKIITAINNPKLNEELKKEKYFEIIGKDIQYKEAILETLEQKKDIDLIIISENIPGEIKLEEILQKIKRINDKIKIIFILEKENIELEKILIKNNIKDIYYNNKINLNELIKIINKKEINMEEEIIKLKKIIEEKNINYNNIENNYDKKNQKNKNEFKNSIGKNLKKIKRRIETKVKEKEKSKNEKYNTGNMSTKIITFSGNYKSGKTTLALIIAQQLSEKNYKVLLIDGDLEKQDLTSILEKRVKENERKNKKRRAYEKSEKENYHFNPKYKNQKNKDKKNFIKKENIIKKSNPKKRKIKLKPIKKEWELINRKNKIYYYKIKRIIKFFTIRINKNFYFYYGLKYLLENKKIIKKELLKKRIIKFFKVEEENYDFIIIDLSKNNNQEINKKIIKNSYTNFVCMEGNLLGIKEVEKLLELYIQEWNINQKSLHIVKNKENIISINSRIISRNLSFNNKIFNIKENKFYYLLNNSHYKRKVLTKNKSIKKDIEKIIKKIVNNK